MAGTLEIAVDMYAGRPNPTLDLNVAEMTELRRRLEAARQQPIGEARELPQLSYRGFLIFNPKQEEELPFKVRIYGGTVRVTEQPPATTDAPQAAPAPRLYRDAGDLEAWLLERAAERGLAADIARMEGPAIGRPDRRQ